MKKYAFWVILSLNLSFIGFVQAAVCSSGPNCRIYCPRDAACSALFDPQTKICCIDCGEIPSNEYYACLDRQKAGKKITKNYAGILNFSGDNEGVEVCIKECVASGFKEKECLNRICL